MDRKEMKKSKTIIAISLAFTVLMSSLFSVAATPSVENVLPADRKITSDLKEQYGLAWR